MITPRRLKTKFTIIDNLRIRYQDSATVGAKVLVFIHGLGGSLESWENNTAYLSQKYRTIAFDLPGFGLSDKPHRQYTLGFYSSFVLRAVRQLKVGLPINILGSSLGGQIAAYIATTNPHLVGNLILISPAGFTPKSFSTSPGLRKFVGIIDAVSRTELKNALSATTTEPVRSTDAFMVQERISMPGAKNAFTSALRHSTTAKRINTTNIKSRTLVIWGREDRLIPVRFIEPFIEMKNCRVCILENCGHRPHAEKPALINETIKRFIEDN
ncbi:MAG: alpha/beta fold hydrolase [Nitrososphaeraceae archaeon]